MNALTNILKPYVNLLAYSDSGNGHYDLELLNRTINVCSLFGNKKYDLLLQVVYRILKEQSNIVIPARCPIIKVTTH